MEYYLKEIPRDRESNLMAVVKPRADIEKIFVEEGMKPLGMESDEAKRMDVSPMRRLFYHAKASRSLDRAFSALKKGDSVYIQVPIFDHSIFHAGVIQKYRKKGVSFFFFIHDLELFRMQQDKRVPLLMKLRHGLEDKQILRNGTGIVVHNRKMAGAAYRAGLRKEQCILLGIFDYLLEETEEKKLPVREYNAALPLIIAGNLLKAKAGYVYCLPDRGTYHLYGINYDGTPGENVQYKGAMLPEELPYRMEGAFGLVWDGPSSHTCEGANGEYLRINNPHKTSLYLASGIPVVIWEEAALAPFVKKHECGLTVASLYDLQEKLEAVDEAMYRRMRENANRVGERIRSGYYTRRAIQACRQIEKEKRQPVLDGKRPGDSR